MDQAGPLSEGPPKHEDEHRVVECRPEGVSIPNYGNVAARLLDNGYQPLPIRPNTKRPAISRWSTCPINASQTDDWSQNFADCGVGLRTGHLVGVDIDLMDPDLAHQAMAIVTSSLGDTLMRVGLWPKRLLLYRTAIPIPKLKVGKIEVLGTGQQFVAFGIHPDTGRPYDWPLGESPLDVPLADLPEVNLTAIEALLAELQPIAGSPASGSRTAPIAGAPDFTRNADGRVMDGRDGWLSRIAFHAIHDATGQHVEPYEAAIASLVWQRFADTTDLSRPRQDGGQHYCAQDALQKVRDKLRLYHRGLLPDRCKAAAEPDYLPPSLGVDDARRELDFTLGRATAAIAAWHQEGQIAEPPRLGIRATVGLGKSTAARRHIAGLLGSLADHGSLPRVLNAVPSLALAEEAAGEWRKLGFSAAVLRGFQALNPVTGEPMCRDLPGVRSAQEAGLDIQSSVCFRSERQRCPHFANCPKQLNRRQVAEAQIVVAAYDVLFTGFAGDAKDMALLLVDEACWQRALEQVVGLTIEALPLSGITGIATSRRQDAQGAEVADLVASRQRLSTVLASLTEGVVEADSLIAQGIDVGFCEEAAKAEFAALPKNDLVPGQGAAERKAASDRCARRAIALRVVMLWDALAGLQRGDPAAVAKVWLDGPSRHDGQRSVRIWRRKHLAADLASLPLIHLDATLRPEIAGMILPGLKVATIEAAAPHQHVRLIAGSFGKGSLYVDPHLPEAEATRRANRLQECVDHVCWHARRHAPGRSLVITYKGIEDAFCGIPNVEVAHYNAVAGLDEWSDIRCLFLIGRPLPSSGDLQQLTGALLDRVVQGDYHTATVAVHVAAGGRSSISAIRHADPVAETLRAAICDDEVMQALGRGRGVNRTADNPLEVHQLADVVLPITYDRVASWELSRPDVVQKMLLAGLAVDSPADAAALHPDVFSTAAQAEKAFQRTGFGGHFPIGDIYREMSVKSASYRKGGRGLRWQRAWWIDGSSIEAHRKLEAALGPVAKWVPQVIG